MLATPTTPVVIPDFRRVNGSRVAATRKDTPTEVDRIIEHFVRREALRPGGQAAALVSRIFTAPPECLRVGRIARRVHVSRRTLGRRFRAESVPSPVDWIVLARAVYAHRSILRGRSLREAAVAAGYADQFTMSNAIHRITGLRPSRLQEVSREEMLDTWIARQRDHGAFAGPAPPSPRTCPLCGGPRAGGS